ncbi:MAG: antitoxin VbhA family protein [Mycobacteriaceae bacterium]|uniref:antitoxin VbhA family protein n=1 Tax=Corynebacterium sp. TaxID=1720 RepID=UPI003F9C8AD9
MTDYRTDDQKAAAVAASMTMAGQPVTPEDEARGRRILRGETSADQTVLEILEEEGLSGMPRAAELRRRITRGA